MKTFVGIAIVLGMVFGGYLAAGGKMSIILKALPFEMTMIGGAAVGAFVIANSGAVLKHTFGDLRRVFSGPKWGSGDYRDLLCLLHELLRAGRQNPMELEEHIESPETSALFSRYPRIQGDREAVEMICDTLRSASMNYDDPHQVEDVLGKRIEAYRRHALHTSHALQVMADGLPALGIVAAVLGVIKTMASIDKPPEILGGLIGAALVGTFLGVFLSYGIVGPMSQRLREVVEDDMQFLALIREVLVASLQSHATAICIEVGRQSVSPEVRPSFSALEDALRDARQAA